MQTDGGKIRPQLFARVCGFLYLYIFIAGMFAENFVRDRLVVPNDASATAANIVANESLFRLGFSGEYLHLACDVTIAALLYALLKPVNTYLSLMAAFFRLAADIVLAVAGIAQFAALRLLGQGDYLSSFQPAQVQSLALFAMRLHGDGYAVCLFFFSFACLLSGYLIYKSTFIPRAIGVLVAIAGICYLTFTLIHFLSPHTAAGLSPGIFVPIFVGEFSLVAWLVVRGVNVPKWEARAARVAG